MGRFFRGKTGNVFIIFSNFVPTRHIGNSGIVIEHLAYEHYYRRLFETYYGSLVNFACRYAHDPEEAEDIVQNIFVAMWNGRVGAGIDLWKITFDVDYEFGFRRFGDGAKAPHCWNLTVGFKIF